MAIVVDRIVRSIPVLKFDSKKAQSVVNWFGNNVSSSENRLILGATALVSQPFIDLNNHKVDQETREMSCARTIAKIIAGTLTGVLIRKGFINLVKSNSTIGKAADNTFKNFFTPSDANANDHAYKQYQNAMGTILAITAMLFTNFAIDAPLTQFLTNHLSKGIVKDSRKEALNDRT